MEIEKYLVQKNFWPENLPEWSGPLCNKGILQTKKDDVKIIESVETSTEHSEDLFECDMCKGAFSGTLVCQNPKCNETIFFSCKAGIDRIYDEEGPTSKFDWRIEPKYFSTPIILFPIGKYPKWAIKILREAFGLLWANESSSAGKIRVLVEKNLDHDADKLSREDLVDALEMIGEALNMLYNSHTQKLKTKAKNVIKSKGPAKPKKIKFGIL